MAHVAVMDGAPGITGLLGAYPETAIPLGDLAEVLLRGPSTLSSGERELIACFVSYLNECAFCTGSHSAVARHLLGDGELVEAVRRDYRTAPISKKMKALLAVAEQVQRGGRCVTAEHIAHARSQGATDREIHDTVLIAAAFCMYNRYVDGLATWTPADPQVYEQAAERLVAQGYRRQPDTVTHSQQPAR